MHLLIYYKFALYLVDMEFPTILHRLEIKINLEYINGCNKYHFIN